MLRYREIKQELQKIIVLMSKGDKLPSRTVLSKKLDASRATIDKAVQELIDEGHLEARFGSGTYVVQRLEGVDINRKNWCLVLPNLDESIYAKLASSVTKAAQENDTNMILCNSENDAEQQKEQIQRLIAAGVDGFIIVPVVLKSVAESIGIYQSLKQSRIPFVLCNRGVEGISAPIVKMSHFYCGYIATLHLIDQGYRNIAYLSNRHYSTSIERCQGYISALQSRGIPISRKHILMLDEGEKADCGGALKKFISSGTPVDAVFCFNDSIAIDAARAVEDLGMRISHDIGIMGCGNSEELLVHSPYRISSISHKDDLGSMAAHVLQKITDNKGLEEKFEYYLIEPVVVVRDSCLGPEKKENNNG